VKGKSVLITGGAGFIGRRLAAELRNENKVTVLDMYSRTSSDYASELEDVRYVRGDVLDKEIVKQTMRGCDVVVHAAGIAGIDTVGRSPVNTIRVNAFGTEIVLSSAIEVEGVERVICFSTSEVFGKFAYDVSEACETSIGPVGQPRWTYAASKLLSEHLAHSYWHEFGLPTVVVRPFNVYGPGQIGEGAVKKFVLRALSDEEIVINGNGNQIRSWCFIDDFIQGILLCSESTAAVGSSFNIGNPRAVATTLDLAQRIINLADSRSRVSHAPALDADILVRIPDTERAEQVLGYTPRVDLDEGLRRTIDDARVSR